MRASMVDLEMNCSTEKSFVAYQTLKSPSNNGENISIRKRRLSALEYRPPAPEAKITLDQRPIMQYPSSCAIK